MTSARDLIEARLPNAKLQAILVRAQAGEKFDVTVIGKTHGHGWWSDEPGPGQYHHPTIVGGEEISRLLKRHGISTYRTSKRYGDYGADKYKITYHVNQENPKKAQIAGPTGAQNVLARALKGDRFDVTMPTKVWGPAYPGGGWEIIGDQYIRTLLRRHDIPHHRTSVKTGNRAYDTTVHVNQIKASGLGKAPLGQIRKMLDAPGGKDLMRAAAKDRLSIPQVKR